MRVSSSLGIYFEDDQIVLVYVKRSFQDFIIKDNISLTLPLENEQQELAYQKVIDFIKKTKGATIPLYLGLSRKEVLLLNLELPSAAEGNLRRVIGYELDGQTPYSKEDAYFDFQIMGRDADKGTLRVLVVVVLKKRLDGILEVVRKMGLRPNAVEISSTALIRVLSYNPSRMDSNNTVLLHRGEKTDEIVMSENGALYHSRSFATPHLREVGRLSAELEKILLSKGWDPEAETAFFLAGEDENDREMILLGLSEENKYKIASVGTLPKGPNGETVSRHFLIPFGLALRGFGNRRDLCTLNLAPRVNEIKENRNSYRIALSLVTLVLLLGGGFFMTPIIQGEQRLRIITEQVEQLRENVELIKKMEREEEAFREKYDQLASIKGDHRQVLLLMKVLTEMIPTKTWLTDLRFKKGQMEISGYSFSSSSLIPILEKSPHFTEVEFSAPITIAEGRNIRNGGNILRPEPFLRESDLELGPNNIKGLEKFKIMAVLEKTP